MYKSELFGSLSLVMPEQPKIIERILQLIESINTIPSSGYLNYTAEYSPLQPDLEISDRTPLMPFVGGERSRDVALVPGSSPSRGKEKRITLLMAVVLAIDLV